MIDFHALASELRSSQDFTEKRPSLELFNVIKRVLGFYLADDARSLSKNDDPVDDMDTLGSLIDKLITVDLKMWHNQEQLYAIRRMNPLEFKEHYEDKLDELHAVVSRCCDLNVQRSRLVDAIDRKLADVVARTDAVVTAEAHKTY